MENVISNAERRAIRKDEKFVVPRVSDVYAALPAITGKLELEYEGEMKGADYVGRELIRSAIAKTYDEYYTGATCSRSCSGSIWAERSSWQIRSPAAEALEKLKEIQGLIDKLGPLWTSTERQCRAAGFGGGVHSRRLARPQAHRTQRGTCIQSWREEARARAREIVRCGTRTAVSGREDSLTRG